MKTSLCLAVCLAALFPASAALADSESNLSVAVVVNMTDQGRKVPKPTSDRPVYYYPITRGYSEGGAILAGEEPPPPTAEVQHMIARALAEQGYLVSTRHSPSLVLIFWWGYKAPVFIAASDQHLPSSGATLNLSAMVAAGGVSSPGATIPGFNFLALPPNLAANHNEMEELVLGSEYEPDSFQNLPNLRLEALINASRVARYYLMVSALDFNAAEQRRPVLLWTARVSTSLWGHTLDQVLPALIATGAPMLGRDSDGPQITTTPVVPLGRVFVGTPVIKVSNSGAP